MTTTVVDKKGRILLPARIRKALRIRQGDRMLVEAGQAGIALRTQTKDRNTDRMFLDFRNPAQADLPLATRKYLEKLEEEYWAGSS